MSFRIEITPAASQMLAEIADRRIREKIAEKIDGLAIEPEKQGKPLTGEFSGYRSLRSVGQRYRIIYRIDRARVIVVVVAIGLRQEGGKKDIYSLAKKLIRFHLVNK